MGMEPEIQENSNTIKFISSSEELQYSSNISRSWNDDGNFIQESLQKFWIFYLHMASKEERWGRSKSAASAERTQRSGYSP